MSVFETSILTLLVTATLSHTTCGDNPRPTSASDLVLTFPDEAVGIIKTRREDFGHYGWGGDIHGGWESPQQARHHHRPRQPPCPTEDLESSLKRSHIFQRFET
jgi:hypothetical protein